MTTSRPAKELANDWLAEKAFRGDTYSRYEGQLKMWYKWLDNTGRDKEDPQCQDISAYVSYCRERGLSAYTINNKLNVLKQFYKWLCAKRDMPDNITRDIRSERQRKFYNKRPLTNEESNRLIMSINTETLAGKRDRLIVSLMLFNGLRACEVSRIEFGDKTSRIVSIMRKGHSKKDCSISLSNDSIKCWDDYANHINWEKYWQDKEDTSPVFANMNRRNVRRGDWDRLTPNQITQIIKLRLEGAGLLDSRLTCHSLRHTYGTNLVRLGVPLEDVRELLGHSSIAMTEIYVKYAQDQRLEENPPADKLVEYVFNHRK